MRRKVVALATALVAVALFSSAAMAELGAVGPVNPASGYPVWVQDKSVPPVRLGICPGADQINCISVPPNPANPIEVAAGFGAEGFWWSADAAFGAAPAPEALLVLAVEAAWGVPTPTPGWQWAFNRIRLRGSGWPALATCTVVHPFTPALGVTVLTDALGNLGGAQQGITEDYGCTAGVPTFPCATAVPGYQLMATPIAATPPDFPFGNGISIFLRALAPPAGFVGSVAQGPVPVTGSPTGNNLFSVTCPPLATLSTDLFTVTGKLTLGPAVYIAAGDFDNDGAQDLAAIDQAGVVWFSSGAAFNWTALGTAPAPATTFTKIISGNFDDTRPGQELAGLTADGRVFVFYNMASPTLLPSAALMADIVAGEFDVARLGDEIVGLATAPDSRVYVPSIIAQTMTGLLPAAGTGKLVKFAAFNFNNVPPTDVVGIAPGVNERVWYSTDLGATWVNVPGSLNTIITGDFDGDGLGEIAGRNKSGKMWWNPLTPPLTTAGWIQIPGSLSQMVSGNFNTLRPGDELAGANQSTKLWKSSTMPAFTGDPGFTWSLMGGAGHQVIKINFNTVSAGDELAMLNTVTGTISTSNDGAIWTPRN